MERQNQQLQQTQLELQASHTHLYHLYELAPVGYLRINEQGIILQCNKKFSEWVKCPSEKVIHHALGSYIADSYQTVYQYWLHSQPKQTQLGNFAIKTCSDKEIFVRAQLSELTLACGEKNLLVTLTDITALKKAEEQLELAAAIFDTSSEGFVITDTRQKVLMANRAFSRITGYSLDDIMGQPISLLKSDKHDPAFYQELWQKLHQDGHWQGEVWNRRKNGEVCPHWLSVNVMYNAQSQPYRYVALYWDITQKKQQEALIYQQATQDPLTGVANRISFNTCLHKMIKLAARHQRSFALILLDLDGFKGINDTLGHGAGDCLLQTIARRLQACIRDSDTVARIGGDEFCLLLEVIPSHDQTLQPLCNKIIEQVSQPVHLDTELVSITASLGIARYPQDADNIDDLRTRADLAMYSAKRSGKNKICFFQPSLQQELQQRHQRYNELEQAIEQQQLSIQYQPIIHLPSGNILKAEALVRWNHPEYGLILPEQFIPLAEESGLIDAVGQHVIQQVIHDLALWKQTAPTIQISVNVSAIQLREFQQQLSQAIAQLQHNQQSHQVVLELTESLLIENSDQVNQSLISLRDARIEVALDDFGTGYSSLSYLQEFDIDYLKIDQSFVQRLTPDCNTHILCEAMIAMAHKLNMKVIAEGIETIDQRNILTQMECDYGQGYLFHRPMSAQQFHGLLSS